MFYVDVCGGVSRWRDALHLPGVVPVSGISLRRG